jgi:DNA repair exonuclease SbcCD ATPase subunit
MEERLAAQKLELAALNDELAGYDERIEILKNVVGVFGRKGVRAHVLETVTPYLNERTAYYLGTLSDGTIVANWSTLAIKSDGELAEKFNILVSKEDGAKEYFGLSGGERRKVRLATSMALQDLVASRASKPINLFIADEIDDALDVSGLERLMGILEEKGRERGTLVLISHNDIGDWVRNVSKVTKSGYYSEISGYLSAG